MEQTFWRSGLSLCHRGADNESDFRIEVLINNKNQIRARLLINQIIGNMKIKLDTLKCVKLMTQHGLTADKVEAIVLGLTDMEINNVYAKSEIDHLIDRVSRKFKKAVDEIMARQDAQNMSIDLII